MEQEPNVQEKDHKEDASQEENSTEWAAPKGALAFVFLMLLFYAVYWAISWVEIFVIRGI
jgi:hypothetical protein